MLLSSHNNFIDKYETRLTISKQMKVLFFQLTWGRPLFLARLLTFPGSACSILPYSSQCSLSSAHAYPDIDQTIYTNDPLSVWILNEIMLIYRQQTGNWRGNSRVKLTRKELSWIWCWRGTEYLCIHVEVTLFFFKIYNKPSWITISYIHTYHTDLHTGTCI